MHDYVQIGTPNNDNEIRSVMELNLRDPLPIEIDKNRQDYADNILFMSPAADSKSYNTTAHCN